MRYPPCLSNGLCLPGRENRKTRLKAWISFWPGNHCSISCFQIRLFFDFPTVTINGSECEPYLEKWLCRVFCGMLDAEGNYVWTTHFAARRHVVSSSSVVPGCVIHVALFAGVPAECKISASSRDLWQPSNSQSQRHGRGSGAVNGLS